MFSPAGPTRGREHYPRSIEATNEDRRSPPPVPSRCARRADRGGSVALLLAGCGASSPTSSRGSSSNATINAVGAENEYANVIEQIGGKYVKATAIESNPNTDPHTFEASPSVAEAVSAASLLIENGVGYGTFMEKIESASPNSSRKVIDVEYPPGLPDSTPNPHLWYKPETMPAVAKALVNDLSALAPAHAAYFQANARSSKHRKPWYAAMRSSTRATRTRRSRRPSRSATTCSSRRDEEPVRRSRCRRRS